MSTTPFTRRRYATATALATVLAGATSLAAQAPAHAAGSVAPAVTGDCPNNTVLNLLNASPYQGTAPLATTVDLKGNTIDPAHGCTLIFHWGDGTPDTSAQSENIPLHHTFAKPGNYTVNYEQYADNGHGPQLAAKGSFVVFVQAPGGSGGGGGALVKRIGGADRYDTGRRVSQAQWQGGQAKAVVLARGDQAPDALAGVPLAAHVHGPLLLTSPTALDAATRAEIDRVTGGPLTHKTVYILGGDSAVSPTIENALRTAGYTVVRYGGTSRYDTALKIAAAFGATQHVIVATGRDFPDALAAGPLGAAEGAPIVLSDNTTLDPATKTFINQHQFIEPVGGQALQAVLPNAAGKAVSDSLAGKDRYATGAAVAKAVAGVIGHAPTAVGIASGTTFPDALTGGAFAANAAEPLLLTAPGSLSDPTASLLSGWASQLTAVTIFGGNAAISGNTFGAILKTVHGTTG